MIPVADDIVLWRERAATARSSAQRMHDARCRGTVLGVAESYERMAHLAECRVARRQRMARISRITFGLAGLLGGGTGCVLSYLLMAPLH